MLHYVPKDPFKDQMATGGGSCVNRQGHYRYKEPAQQVKKSIPPLGEAVQTYQGWHCHVPFPQLAHTHLQLCHLVQKWIGLLVHDLCCTHCKLAVDFFPVDKWA